MTPALPYSARRRPKNNKLTPIRIAVRAGGWFLPLQAVSSAGRTGMAYSAQSRGPVWCRKEGVRVTVPFLDTGSCSPCCCCPVSRGEGAAAGWHAQNVSVGQPAECLHPRRGNHLDRSCLCPLNNLVLRSAQEAERLPTRYLSSPRAGPYAATKRSSSTRSPKMSRSAMNAVGSSRWRRAASVTRSLSWSTTSMGCPCSSTPSAYRAQLATTAAERSTSPPAASWWRITGRTHFGMRSELCAHRRATVSRTSGLEKRSISVSLYSSRSIPARAARPACPRDPCRRGGSA